MAYGWHAVVGTKQQYIRIIATKYGHKKKIYGDKVDIIKLLLKSLKNY